MFNKIDKVLKKQLNKVSLGEVAQAAYVCHIANSVASGRFKALSFRDGTLEVGVINNIEAMKIQANKMQIIEEINNKLKSKKVEKLRFKIY
ncbi:MAG: hypothetical protein ACD_58C00317G0004 [uncultured bacterium]|nr:MAG: hypothetical protein ACD_58C00317G0004 [uncultured bacterium]